MENYKEVSPGVWQKEGAAKKSSDMKAWPWIITVFVMIALFPVWVIQHDRRSQPKPSVQSADKDEYAGARSVWLHNEISLTDPCDPTIGGFVEVNGVLYICQNAIVWTSWPDVPPLPKVYIPKELQ